MRLGLVMPLAASGLRRTEPERIYFELLKYSALAMTQSSLILYFSNLGNTAALLLVSRPYMSHRSLLALMGLLFLFNTCARIPDIATYSQRIHCGLRAAATTKHMNEAGKVLNLGTEELNRLLETYLNTSGMSRLSSGYIGDRAHPAAGELHQSVLNSTRFVLQLCAEHGGLVPGYRKQGTWAIPEVPTLPMCGGKRLHLVVVTHLNVKPGYKMTEGMLGRQVLVGVAVHERAYSMQSYLLPTRQM